MKELIFPDLNLLSANQWTEMDSFCMTENYVMGELIKAINTFWLLRKTSVDVTLVFY